MGLKCKKIKAMNIRNELVFQYKFDIIHVHPLKWGIQRFLSRIQELINSQDQFGWMVEIGNEIQLEWKLPCTNEVNWPTYECEKKLTESIPFPILVHSEFPFLNWRENLNNIFNLTK